MQRFILGLSHREVGKWDQRWLDMAQLVASWSRDPSTQVGAVCVDRDLKYPLSLGYNGFARGVSDTPQRYSEREVKYAYVVHAEVNAIAQATLVGQKLRGCIMYCTMFPCHRCTPVVINAGIKEILVPFAEIPERWKDSMNISMKMCREAGVKLTILHPDDTSVYKEWERWNPSTD
jgi:dCMP deaminase